MMPSREDGYSMHNKMGTRYIPGTRIISLPQGTLHDGEDVFLTRKVLLYNIKLVPGQIGADYMRTLHHKAAFIHDGFQHILDTSVEEDSVTIILQAKPGALFSRVIHKQPWTFHQIITMIADLGVSLLDALEERITGFSVAAENLWLDDHHKLTVINYWDEGDAQAQGAIGLCRLMLQLFSGTQPSTTPFEVIHTQLERTPIPSATPEQKAALIKLVKLICQGQASLSSFVFGLRSLQPSSFKEEAFAAPIHRPSRSQKAQVVAHEEEDVEEEEETEQSYTKNRLRKVGIGASAVFVVAIAGWILWPSSEKKQPVVNTPVQTATPTPQTSTPTPTPVPTKTVGDANKQPVEVEIPNLLGKALADAEQEALALRLRYNFVIEASTSPDGTVFKQDPQPGTKGFQGDSVTFWVSKQSQ